MNKQNKPIYKTSHINNSFLSQKELHKLIIYISLFFVFSIRIFPKDIIFFLVILIFTSSSLKNSLLMFLFFSLWENVTVFSFGISLNLILQVILGFKILLKIFQESRSIKFKKSELFALIIVFLYGILNFFFGTGTLVGIGIGVNFLIAIYSFKLYKNQKEPYDFWKAVFLILMISTFIAILYGVINNTAINRWIRGIGYTTQIYGTLGTTRMGMFIVASLIYPVYYEKNKILKMILSIILSGFALMTVSLTTFICLFVFWAIVLIYKLKLNRKNIIRFSVIALIIISIMLLFQNQIKQISFINAISTRLYNLFDALRMGDIEYATTKRSTLFQVYLNKFLELPLFNKLFGSFNINIFSIVTKNNLDVTHYSHNSLVDLVIYSGFFGVILFILFLKNRLKYYKKSSEHIPIFLLKLIFLLSGLTVSMLSSTYWLIWVLI